MKGLRRIERIKENLQPEDGTSQGFRLLYLVPAPIRLIINEASREIAGGNVVMKRLDKIKYERPVMDYMGS